MKASFFDSHAHKPHLLIIQAQGACLSPSIEASISNSDGSYEGEEEAVL